MFNLRNKDTQQVNRYDDKAGANGFLAAVEDPHNWEEVSDADLEAKPKE